jgi:hypothetical protein
VEAGQVVRVPVQNRSSTTMRTMKVISAHENIIIDEVEYASFLGRRARFNGDGTVSTYGADHAYLVELANVEEI